jgi:type II secretory pathway component PulF
MSYWIPIIPRFARKRISLPFVWPGHTTSAQRRGLLRLIAVSLEQKLPFVPLLEAWTADERGTQYYRVRWLVHLLNQGTPLADAVEQIPGILRDEDVLAIRFDAQSGTVTKAIRENLDDRPSEQTSPTRRLRSTLWYFFAISLCALPIITFMMFKIWPALREIFSEFGLQLPAVTELFLRFIELFVHFAWLPILVIIALLASLAFARPGRFVRLAAARYVGPFRDKSSADLLRKIAIATNAGRPVPGALSTLARYHFDPTIRHKLLFVRNEIEQGADLWESMGVAELINHADVRALNLAERIGNRSWVLTQLAYAKSRRAMRRLDRMSQLVLPVVVILIGLFVLFQALAVFVPLTNMIRALAA